MTPPLCSNFHVHRCRSLWIQAVSNVGAVAFPGRQFSLLISVCDSHLTWDRLNSLILLAIIHFGAGEGNRTLVIIPGFSNSNQKMGCDILQDKPPRHSAVAVDQITVA
jgi:hypothetical protein